MTFERLDGIAVCDGVADSGWASAGSLLRTPCLQRRTGWLENLSPPPARGGLAGALLGAAAPLAFCLGLVALAASAPLEATAPRWFILVYGAGCVLLALLAVLLSGPGRTPAQSAEWPNGLAAEQWTGPYAASKIVAMPCPAPMHIVARPSFAPRSRMA